MEEDKITEEKKEGGVEEEAESVELVLFQVSECYVYMVNFDYFVWFSFCISTCRKKVIIFIWGWIASGDLISSSYFCSWVSFYGIVLFILRLIRSVFIVIDECVAARKGLISSYLEKLHNLSILFLQIGKANASVSQKPESVLLQLFYYLSWFLHY